MTKSDASARHTPEESGVEAVDASVFVLPRLAAFGPALNLRALDKRVFSHEVDHRLTRARLGHMMMAACIGLLVLVAPMSALAYAAERMTGASAALQHQQVPGEDPVAPPVPPRLIPADGGQ